MWHCDECGADFDAPRIITTRENLDGENGWETQRTAVCPCCGSEEVEEARTYAE